MKIINDNNKLSRVCLILGFFDGIHLGHKNVISNAVEEARKHKTSSVLLTFKNSPAQHFKKEYQYIYTRKQNYKYIEDLGVDFIIEEDFSKLANISADNYLQNYLIEQFNPLSITSGFNYSFGFKRTGTPELLKENQNKYNYKYFCIPAVKKNGQAISSSLIKQTLEDGNIEKAATYLGRSFSLKSTVIKGKQLGRIIGFPTANLIYPSEIVQIPHGVYIAEVLGKKALLNWGVKPTFNENKELLEVHIPNFYQDLYNENLEITFLKKIRDEKKFKNVEELKIQIEKDLICLES